MISRYFPNTLLSPTTLRRFILFVITCAACVLVVYSSGSSGASPSKKLIDFGADNPKSEFVRRNITKMEKQSFFSGFTMLLAPGTNVFNKTAYPESEFASDRANLKATRFKKFTHNFIRMDTRREEGWTWLNDANWEAALENVRQFTRTAKVGKFDGIFFDTESYGSTPWKYKAEDYDGKSYKEVSVVVRQRGRDFINVVHQEMPGAKIISLWFLRIIKKMVVDDGRKMENMDWALLVPFFEGWLDGGKGEQFIDGNENSYFNLTKQDYAKDRAAFTSSAKLLSASSQAKFKQRVRLAHAMFLDGSINWFRSPRFAGFYFPSDQSRLQQVEHNIYESLKTSDEYVWAYSEHVDWWKGSAPKGLAAAMKRGVDKVQAGKPLGFDMKAVSEKVKKDYERRIFIRGKITKADKGLYQTAAVVESGYKDLSNKESACTISPEGEYTCELPYGWKGTLTPKLANESFEPPMRDYSNKTFGPGAWLENQNFATR
ncbi:MAG: hypothetical protein RLZZ135_954 [Cyanobacteriota bacterium]